MNNRRTTGEQRKYNRTTTEIQPKYNEPPRDHLQRTTHAIRTAQARPGNIHQSLSARMPAALPRRSAGRNNPAAQEPRPASEFGAQTFALRPVIVAFLYGAGSITMGRTQTMQNKP
jgi:hypothetical protein